MNPIAKFYTARLALLAIVAVPLMFFINALLALAAGLIVSMVLGYVLLKRQREEMIDYVDAAVNRRRDEKQQLRAELAGDDEQDPQSAAEAGKGRRPAEDDD